MDRYESMTALLEAVPAEGNYHFHVDRRYASRVKIFAPHGGCIEPCTSPVAAALADGLFDCFLFNGTRKQGCFKTLHVTSAHYDEPRCREMAAGAALAVSIHGSGEEVSRIQVGGGNVQAAGELCRLLLAGGYPAVRPSDGLLGAHPDNFINLARCRGVQIELSAGFRKLLFPAFPAGLQKNPAEFSRFVDTLRRWIGETEAKLA